jgi:predicted SAM-dependent methyltransferase
MPAPAATSSARPSGPRLHVGCGRARLEGWINIDMQELPGVDVVADVTGGLEFRGCEAVYAEHFLEHLRVDLALDFLEEAHRVLGDGGRIRLSTPNLDWVWLTHYRLEAPAEVKTEMAIHLNRAFHGWEHRFLWNREILAESLESCGFEELEWCGYRESRYEIFRGIERHETYEDSPDLPHVLIVEAARGPARPERLAALRDRIARDFLAHLKG